MAKTRGRPATKAATAPTESIKTVNPKALLNAEETNVPRIFILPNNVSTNARIVTLENPRYATDHRYLVCPDQGFSEFKKITAPRTIPRSWLLVSEADLHDSKNDISCKDGLSDESLDVLEGYVLKRPDLFIATPIDPLFMILPVLAPVSKTSDSAKRLFLSYDDYIDKLISASPHLRRFLDASTMRASLGRRMAAVCDTVDAGEETMYRMNEEKLFKEILRKAKKMIEHGLPASIEQKLIRKALEAPVISIKRGEEPADESFKDSNSTPASSGTQTPGTDSQDTDISTDTTATTVSEASTAMTSVTGDTTDISKSQAPNLSPLDCPEGVAQLLRIRTAFNFICSNYLAPHLSEMLKKSLSSSASLVDFKPVDTHIEYLTKLRQEALAARSLGDYSRKRAMAGDDEEVEARASKKQKQEEEEKRKKAGESRGVKNLKKVNTSGMKKMSDFFKKK